MKKIVWILAAVGAARLAAAQEMVKLEPSTLVMPARIGPLTVSGAPHKYDPPGAGISYQYIADGLSLTIYIYDADITDLADGADTGTICREFEIAKQGIAQAYQKVELKSERLVRVGEGPDAPLVREAQFEFERQQQPTISYVWITAAVGKFVKLRFSADPRLRDELPDARRAVLTAVADAVRPNLKPVDPKAEKPGASMALNLSGAGDPEMASGMMYLVFLTALVDKSPELGPVCGGALVPSYEVELSTWREMFAVAEGESKSKLGKLVAAAEAAGFMEEFVWLDLHRDEWGAQPPEGLTLDAYEPWRKKHLKKFRRPNFGQVVIDHPRPMPVEPL